MFNKNENEEIENLRISLNLKDNFASKRHNEKERLIILRNDLGMKVLNRRDEIASKRHGEKIQIMRRSWEDVE